MAPPVNSLKIDWENAGTFTANPLIDTVVAVLNKPGTEIVRDRGASADFTSDAMGSFEFWLNNDDDKYTEDRNWLDNPSFEGGTTGWLTIASTGLTAAATSITQVADVATGTGSKAGSVVLTATLNSGVYFVIPANCVCQNGVPYQGAIWMKSISGNTNIQAGIASQGTPADLGNTGASVITGAWVQYPFSWTPSANRTDAVFYIRTTTAAAATLRIDAGQLNPGTILNTFIEAPTKGQLVQGRPVLWTSSFGGTQPGFYGFIELLTPDPVNRTVKVKCFDPMRQMGETDVAFYSTVKRTARELRLAILEDAARGNLNFIVNPSFETNTTGWSVTGGVLTRITTDSAPNGISGTACAQWAAGVVQTLTYTAYPPALSIANVTYRWTVWLKCTIGTGANWRISAGTSFRDLTGIASSWAPYTITTSDISTTGIALSLRSSAADTVLIDAAQFTRGQAQYAYSDTGSGRWPNFCVNGSFDAGDVSGWYNATTNICTNGNFVTATTGWSILGDAFVGASTSITRTSGAGGPIGTTFATVVTTAVALKGVFFALTYTFLLGVQYSASIWVKPATNATSCQLTIGSQGTPADKLTQTQTLDNLTFHKMTALWTPSANRTDAHLSFTGCDGGNLSTIIGGAMVVGNVTAGNYPATYMNTGPGGGGSFPTSFACSSAKAAFGTQSLAVVTPATALAGIVFDFGFNGQIFEAGRQYSVAMYLGVLAGTFPFKIGISANLGDGTFSEATTTGTATTTMAQVTFNWTPSATVTTVTGQGVVLFVYQTDGTARTFYVDAIRVHPGAADAYEMAQWDVDVAAESSDIYKANIPITGTTCLAAMQLLNALTLSRMWIQPQTAAPFFQIRIEDRTTFAAKTASEVLTDDPTVQVYQRGDIDRSQIVNVVQINWTGSGTEYYSDGLSVGTPGSQQGYAQGGYGPRPTTVIDGSQYFPDRTIPDKIGPIYVARYGKQRGRPTMKRENNYAVQLARDLNDRIDFGARRFRVYRQPLIILHEKLTIKNGGTDWLSEYTTIEYSFI